MQSACELTLHGSIKMILRYISFAMFGIALGIFLYKVLYSDLTSSDLMALCRDRSAEPSEVVLACTVLADADDITTDALFDVLIAREVAFRKLGEVGHALDDINSALALRPTDANILVRRGQVRRLSGEFQLAENDYQTAIALEPNNFWAWMSRANAFFEQQKYEDALFCYQRATEIAPDDLQASDRTIITLTKLGEHDLAIETLTEASQRWPKNATIHRFLGVLYLTEKKNYDRAIQALLASDDIEADNEETQFFLGAAYLRNGEYGRGMQYVERFATSAHQSVNEGSRRRDGIFASVVRDIAVGDRTLPLYRGIAYALIGETELARSELIDFMEAGGILTTETLIRLMEKEGIFINPQPSGVYDAEVEEALNQYIDRLTQKFLQYRL